MNYQLRGIGLSVKEMSDLSDGILLGALLEVLTGLPLLSKFLHSHNKYLQHLGEVVKGIKKGKLMRIHKINNCHLCLDHMKNHGMDLQNLSAESTRFIFPFLTSSPLILKILSMAT